MNSAIKLYLASQNKTCISKKIKRLLRSKDYATRIAEILKILSKYGLAFWLNDSKVEFIQKILKDQKGEKLNGFTLNEKLRKACEELGPAFIKLGQILSTRPDLIGKELSQELTKLQDSTPEDSDSWVKQLFVDELQKAPEELFKTFEYKPIASASIGQVHLATTHQGHHLAIKILHQEIKKKMTQDLQILLSLAELAEKYIEVLRKLRISDVVSDFNRTFINELNLTREAQNINKFKTNFKDQTQIIFPTVYKEFCTDKILSMSFEEGINLNRMKRHDFDNLRLIGLAHEGAEMYLDMIFRDNFYHADPHPGNLLITKEGRLVILDFGMVGSLNTYILEDIEDMIFAIISNDAPSITESIYRVCEVSSKVEKKKLTGEIDYWLREYLNQNFSQIDMSRALDDFNKLIKNFEIIMPSNLALLFKVLVQLDGTARLLHPEFNVMDVLKPYYSKLIKQRLQPQYIFKKVIGQAKDWYRVAHLLPKTIVQQLDALNSQQLSLNLQHKGLESSVNRLVLGIIAASLFIGSVILWSLRVPPLMFNTSFFGMLGYVIAIIIIFKLVRDIFRA